MAPTHTSPDDAVPSGADGVRSLVGSRTLPRQLNVAGAGPLCTPAHELMSLLLRGHHRGGYEHRDALIGRAVLAREQVAALMGTLPQLVTFQPSVSAFVTTLSRSVPLERGDQVLTWDVEFASNVRAWHVRAQECGAELVRVQPRLDAPWDTAQLLEQVDERTRVVTVSSVQSVDGAVTDLYALRAACDEVGALLLVDLSQHLGIADVRSAVALADATYSSTHKWLLGPLGMAVASVTPDLLGRLVPPAYGSASANPLRMPSAAVWFDPTAPLRDDVRALEAGTPALMTQVGVGAAAAALERVGVPFVQERALAARTRLAEVLAEHALHPLPTVTTPLSPILAVRPGPERLGRVVQGLEAERFSFVVRGDILRLSPWAVAGDELDDMAAALDRAVGPGGPVGGALLG